MRSVSRRWRGVTSLRGSLWPSGFLRENNAERVNERAVRTIPVPVAHAFAVAAASIYPGLGWRLYQGMRCYPNARRYVREGNFLPELVS
jgi:hypothetical protein